ncbi:PAP2 family protein [Chryseobacterium nematophagum]|uniref:PAP2 family protein n=1 Tax=Chryseobacterium nematophagum TaxID=2305228 RepID=A0A3M7TB03_9FLAO|nr:phosphatase PAP2 family protein [Chryseobacterium nematophagum]RNA60492.1 PAP2 family protein [Chryseobacterium nematophagum]
MNKFVIQNYAKIGLSLLYFPLFLLILISIFLYQENTFSREAYANIQKDSFLFINSKLSHFPYLINNLSQFGNALIILSFLTIFVVYAPKLWEALLSASLISIIPSSLLKVFFKVPRPAAVYDQSSFVIIGKTLTGSNSLPSGHSITIFTVLTILLWALMPQKLKYKVLWFGFIIIIGIILTFTRVGVGAHYPLDVIIGSIIGYMCGILGIFINQKYSMWSWINHKKYYFIFILLFIGCIIALVNKILHENLIVFYLALISLIISIYIITYIYVKK